MGAIQSIVTTVVQERIRVLGTLDVLVVIDLNREPGGMIDNGPVVSDQDLVRGNILRREEPLPPSGRADTTIFSERPIRSPRWPWRGIVTPAVSGRFSSFLISALNWFLRSDYFKKSYGQ